MLKMDSEEPKEFSGDYLVVAAVYEAAAVCGCSEKQKMTKKEVVQSDEARDQRSGREEKQMKLERPTYQVEGKQMKLERPTYQVGEKKMKLERPTYQVRERKMSSPEEEGEEDKATTQSLASRRENAMSAKRECDVDIDVGKEKNAMMVRG